MPKKKKVGGIKARAKAPARASACAPTPKKTVGDAKKKIGGVKAPPTRKHHYCRVGCEGSWRNGMWCHDNWCKELRMIWKAHGQRKEDWMCWYGCPGLEVLSGWTHHWECEFWKDHPELTPFDHLIGGKKP